LGIVNGRSFSCTSSLVSRVHGPDTHAHGSRPARKPGKTNSAECGGCAAREVKSGIGSKHRNQDRERNKAVVLMTDHRFSRHRSSLHTPFLNPSPWRECIFKCDDVTETRQPKRSFDLRVVVHQFDGVLPHTMRQLTALHQQTENLNFRRLGRRSYQRHGAVALEQVEVNIQSCARRKPYPE
jgi:hypothetical protein